MVGKQNPTDAKTIGDIPVRIQAIQKKQQKDQNISWHQQRENS